MGFSRKYFLLHYFIFCILIIFSSEGKAISGSITDPALSSSVDDVVNTQSIRGSIKTKITRDNITFSNDFDEFVSSDQKDSLINGWYVTYDLNLSYPVASAFSFLDQSSFFEDVDSFFVLNYQRPLYADAQKIQAVCWNTYICFGDVNLGISKPVVQTGRFKSRSSIYLSIPFSKRAFDTSFLAGLGASFDTIYKLLSNSYFHLSTISTHFVDLRFYLYETDSPKAPNYNVPFTTFHQFGFQINYPKKSSFIPRLFFYGKYDFSINFKGTPFHHISLSGSLSWSVSKKVTLVAGLNWGDHVLKSQSEAMDTVIFHPDRTFISLGGSYSF